MSQVIRIQPTRFVNAEPGVLPYGGGIPVVVLSFGAEEGPIEDRAIQVNEARQVVVDTLSALAEMGDPLAQEISGRYFSDNGPEQGPDDGPDSYDEGPDFGGGFGGCPGHG